MGKTVTSANAIIDWFLSSSFSEQYQANCILWWWVWTLKCTMGTRHDEQDPRVLFNYKLSRIADTYSVWPTSTTSKNQKLPDLLAFCIYSTCCSTSCGSLRKYADNVLQGLCTAYCCRYGGDAKKCCSTRSVYATKEIEASVCIGCSSINYSCLPHPLKSKGIVTESTPY